MPSSPCLPATPLLYPLLWRAGSGVKSGVEHSQPASQPATRSSCCSVVTAMACLGCDKCRTQPASQPASHPFLLLLANAGPSDIESHGPGTGPTGVCLGMAKQAFDETPGGQNLRERGGGTQSQSCSDSTPDGMHVWTAARVERCKD
eukprot:366530-Chlamydomonas_euryale.AAC.1